MDLANEIIFLIRSSKAIAVCKIDVAKRHAPDQLSYGINRSVFGEIINGINRAKWAHVLRTAHFGQRVETIQKKASAFMAKPVAPVMPKIGILG